MKTKTSLARRNFLRSSTAMIALPFLESFGFRRFASAATQPAIPKRMVFLGIGFGVTQETWLPKLADTGSGYTLPDGLAPLKEHKADFSIVQNTTNKHSAEAHWGSTYWLTGANRYGSPGSSFHNTISADQVAAKTLGGETRFASLRLNGGDTNLNGPGHGPGLSLAWDAGGKPLSGIDDPVALFHKLFSPSTMALDKRKSMLARERSVLDAVFTDAKDLQKGLTSTDVDKLDEYFTGIRDIEVRLGKEESWMGKPKPKTFLPEPKNRPKGKDEVRLMYDLIAAALQTDSTRVLTYRQPISSLLTSIGVQVLAHDMSHYHPGVRMLASQARDQVQSDLLAGLFTKLKSIKEADGSSLFDHTSLAFGSNLRSIHYLDNCATLLAGGGSGVRLGEHLVLPKATPLCNVWLSLLNGIGIKQQRFGDSTGPASGLVA